MKAITVLHLYPNEMNVYGDYGNRLVLERRIEWHGYKPDITYYHPGQPFPKQVDIIIGGGGADAGQSDIQNDLLRIGNQLHQLAEKDTPMLMVCGLYQLFGKRFVTKDGIELTGIGLFDLETLANEEGRLIGNVAASSEFGMLYGFENHSGRTYLQKGQAPLAKVTRGRGNNGHDGSEGARTHNVFGTYLHGPILPNNPSFADYLIRKAAESKYGEFNNNISNDTLSQAVRSKAAARRY